MKSFDPYRPSPTLPAVPRETANKVATVAADALSVVQVVETALFCLLIGATVFGGASSRRR